MVSQPQDRAAQALERFQADVTLERQAWDQLSDLRYQESRYERYYLDVYYEPWRLSVTWISNFDTTAGRTFLSKKE